MPILGIAYKLHTLVFVEEYSNAAAIRDEMFKQGWNARGFHGNSINAQGVEEKGYETIIVWSYDSVKATQVASMLPGAYPLTVPNGLDAVAMAKAGILRQYLEAVLIDAKKSETMTCTPRTSNQALT